MNQSSPILQAFIIGLAKQWNLSINNETIFNNESDLFESVVLPLVRGREREQHNKTIASLFGVVVTKVKTFPTSSGSWMIIDKHTKHLLHKDLKNEYEAEVLCKKNNYIK
jgi:hypothetical protein